MTSAAILQSSYIPWKGYFDLLNEVDHFVVFDHAQFTRRDWRSRNRIKTAQGTQWLTIPVSGSSHNQKICEVEVADQTWRKKHWNAIQLNYSRAPFFKEYSEPFRRLYLESNETSLSRINMAFIEEIVSLLGITTKIRDSRDFELAEDRNQRLIDICKELKADTYLSGPAAQGYLDETRFDDEKIQVKWMDYSGYPEYEQLYPPFEHQVSILDLIFNKGPETATYMKSFSGAIKK